mgnify:CR=1 FL=1
MAEHISSQFNQELETVRTMVMKMGGLVEQDLFYAYDMAAFGSELRNYMSGRLSRVEAE